MDLSVKFSIRPIRPPDAIPSKIRSHGGAIVCFVEVRDKETGNRNGPGPFKITLVRSEVDGFDGKRFLFMNGQKVETYEGPNLALENEQTTKETITTMMDNFSLDDLKDTPFAELAALVSKIKADGPNRFCVDFLRLLYFGSLRHGTAFTKDGEALELKQIGQHIPGIGGLYFLPRLAALQIGQVLFVVLRELETSLFDESHGSWMLHSTSPSVQIFFKQAMKYWMDFVKKDVNRRKDEHGCDSQRTEKSGEWLDALEKDVGF